MPLRSLSFVVIALLVAWAAVAGKAATVSGQASSAPAVSAQTASYCPIPEARELLELINAHREVNGRQPLVLSVSLGAAAVHHAESMASFDYFDYTLIPEGISFAENITNYGYSGTYLGANIASGPSSDQAATVFSQWLASPSQRDNLLNPGFLAIGLGFAANSASTYTNYWAATFGEVADDPVSHECDIDGATPESGEIVTISGSPTATATPETVPSPELTTAEDETPVVEPTSAASPIATETASATATASPSPAAQGSPITKPSSPVGSPPAAATPLASAQCAADLDGAIAGEHISVTCSGFEPGEKLSLFWDEPRDENLLGTIDADDAGGGVLSLLAPETPSGRYTIIVRGAGTQETATVPFDIRPGLFVLPQSGDPGDVVTADLTGFQPGEAVTLNWHGDGTETRVLRVVTVGEDGSLTTTFRAPASAAGDHDITAVGISGTKASAQFEIQAS